MSTFRSEQLRPPFVFSGSLSQGANTSASGDYSHAEGIFSLASGQYSHAEGQYTTASGVASHTEGVATIAVGDYSHAEGYGASAIGGISHAEGSGQALAQASHAEGSATYVMGNLSHVEGFSTLVADPAMKYELYDSGGFYYVTSLKELYVQGDVTSVAPGDSYAIARFYDNPPYPRNGKIASSTYDSHGGGFTVITFVDDINDGLDITNTDAQFGVYFPPSIVQDGGAFLSAHAEGTLTFAEGLYSHAEGYASHTIGTGSHAEGLRTTALGDYQHVQGQYNLTSSIQSAFIVGNGADNNNRSNLIHAANTTVEITGSLEVTGSLKQNGYEIRPYKVYTALITQNSSDSTVYSDTMQNDPFIVGLTYTIGTYNTGDDFTNVGAPSNTSGVSFVATGTTAANWSNGSSLSWVLSAPKAMVLENTIGNIYFEYLEPASYRIYGDFTLGKTTSNISEFNPYLIPVSGLSELPPNSFLKIATYEVDGTYLTLLTKTYTGSGPTTVAEDDGQLNRFLLEIRVYN